MNVLETGMKKRAPKEPTVIRFNKERIEWKSFKYMQRVLAVTN